MSALEIVFWVSVAVLLYAQAAYPLLLIAAASLVPARRTAPSGATPSVSLIVCAHNEERVIAAKVANALALRWPRERLEVIVCSDGSEDGTVAAARAAGADLVLDLPWRGKVRAQDAGAAAGRGELLAFSDANVLWEPDALAALLAAFDDPSVGYACGRIEFVQGASGAQADNQEDVYWRFEMALRGAESRFRSITAGNGGIHAVRRDAYLVVGELLDHDLTFPFSMVKRGLRAVDVPAARASEKMVPSLDGEFARKRRMMGYIWAIVLRSGMLDPRGYGVRYGWMILSHRVLRYSAPAWHLVALGANVALVALGAGPLYVACLAAQGALLAAALAGARLRLRPLLLARWYVLMNTAMASGLWDHLHGPNPVGWTAPEGDAMIRRAFDLVAASLALALSSPLLLAAIVAIRLESPGPAIYRQRRVGLRGAEFDVRKLRTMVAGAERIGAGIVVDVGDPRITRVGALLRRSSLDELPNLINVLRGEMSIIGPRPTVREQVVHYSEHQRRRLEVKPGITGWAQVNGRTSLPWSERIELDIWYIDHRSLALDARILARTVRVLLHGGGLYGGESGGWDGPAM